MSRSTHVLLALSSVSEACYLAGASSVDTVNMVRAYSCTHQNLLDQSISVLSLWLHYYHDTITIIIAVQYAHVALFVNAVHYVNNVSLDHPPP